MFKKIELDEVLGEISEMTDDKTSGPSGIGASHLKYMVKSRRSFFLILT